MKKILISIIAIFSVIIVATTFLAQESKAMDVLNQLKQNNVNKNTLKENQVVENIASGNVENKNTNLNTDKKNNVVNNKNENLPTTTPHTGIGDYSSVIFIAVFGVCAVYAYKKVKEYNI